MQEQGMIGLEWAEDVELPELHVRAASAAAGPEGSEEKSEVSSALQYMVKHALRFGRVTGFDDLLDRVARYQQYLPYNSLLLLLQRPGVSYVLPAHRWEDDYRRRIRPGEQPLVALVRGGPLMFVFDIEQTEETPESRPVRRFKDPFRMTDLAEAEDRLRWVTENAKADGVRVSPGGLGLGYGGCIWPVEGAPEQRALVRRRPQREYKHVPIRYETLLSRRLSATEQLAVLSHELGHLYCGHIGTHEEKWWRSRPGLNPEVKEAEADAVARIVIGSLAPDLTLPSILRRRFDKQDLHGLSLETMTKAAGRILDMTSGLAPRRDPYVSKRDRRFS